MLRQYRANRRVFLGERFIPFPIQSHVASLPWADRRIIALELANEAKPDRRNLRAALHSNFGTHLSSLFFEPFLNKYYGHSLDDLAADTDRGSIPTTDRALILAGASGVRLTNPSDAPQVYYPIRGMRHFFARYSAPVFDQIQFQEEVQVVDLQRRRLVTQRGEYAFTTLISTIPLSELLSRLHGVAPAFVSGQLRSASTQVVNVVITQRRRKFQWVYLPQVDLPFYRVGYYPERNPVSIYLERNVDTIGHRESNLHEGVAHTLRSLGMIVSDAEIRHMHAITIPVSYVLFDHNWQHTVPQTLRWLRGHGIYSIGRYGAWRYSSMVQDIAQAMQIMRDLRNCATPASRPS
jgi:protoporphyrinogen oxidase